MISRPFSILPDGYIELEYIESTGTQYIDTGYAPNGTNTGFDIKYSYTSPRNYETAIGTLLSSGKGYFGLATSISAVYRYWDDGISKPFSLEKNKIYHVTENYFNNKKFIWDDGALEWDLASDATITTGNIWLFRFNPGKYTGANQPFYGKMYRCTITNIDEVVRDFIPTKRISDNAVGMFDTVTKTFFENIGTGTFIAGSEIVIDGKIRSQRLPDEYEELEYIQSTGGQCINTQWHPTSKILEIDFKVMALSSMATTSICGDENTSFSGARWLFTLYGQRDDWRQYPLMGTWNNQQGSNYFISTPKDVAVGANLKYNDGVMECTSTQGNRWTHEQTGDQILSHTQSLYLFQNISTQRSTIRMYYFSIYDNNKIVRNFIPARRKSDTEIGLYDIVTRAFYANAGTGKFIGGPKVEGITKQVTIPQGNVREIKVNGIPYWHSELLANYDILDYLESSGTQYIDTEYIANPNTNIKLKGRYDAVATVVGQVMLGTRTSSSGVGVVLSNYAWSDPSAVNPSTPLRGYFLDIKNLNDGYVRMPFVAKEDFVFETNGGKIYFNGDLLNPDKDCPRVSTPTTSLFMFRCNGGAVDVCVNAKVYYCKLYNNNNLVRNFIPVRRKIDGKKGMYDLVTKRLFENKGTGVFGYADMSGNYVPPT